MKLEAFVSNMMRLNSLGRIWHWGTDNAQHHVTFEKFLTENEQFTDSFVESVLGNNIDFDVSGLNITATLGSKYSLEDARAEIDSYRSSVRELQGEIESKDSSYQGELVGILDDVIESCSKTLYLLKLK